MPDVGSNGWPNHRPTIASETMVGRISDARTPNHGL